MASSPAEGPSQPPSSQAIGTPLQRSSRPPTPRKRASGMVQPSPDGRTTISLPQSSRIRKTSARTKESVSNVSNQASNKRSRGLMTSKKRSRASRSKENPIDVDLPSEAEMNQDSDDNLTERQQAKRAKVLEGEDNQPKYDDVKDYYGEPEWGDDNDKTKKPLVYPCLWCPKKPRVYYDSNSNLKQHRDGYTVGRVRKPCAGRQAAIDAGGNLPPTAIELEAQKSKKDQRQLAEFFDLKQPTPFSNDVLNQILTVWILAQALPWNQIEDHFLRVAFRYIRRDVKVFGRTWVAREAAGMYVSFQDTVLKEINGNAGRFTLIHDGWTTANNIHAFLGAAVTFINDNWNYQVRHLTLKLVAWHHNGKWLAQPLVHFMKKHKLQYKMLCQVTDSGSNNITMAEEMHAQFSDLEANDLNSSDGQTYTWNPKTDYAKCFLHKLSSTVKGGLLELGRTIPSRDSQRESLLGAFPISERMPVIAEEDEDESSNSNTTKVIDLEAEVEAEEENLLPDEDDTDHDSEGEDFLGVAPDYDEDAEDKLDEVSVEQPNDATPASSNVMSNLFHNRDSRKQAKRLNELMAQANFISRRVARSAAWRRYFARKAKEMDLKVLPLTPGYNATRWNAKFDSLNCLVKAQKVVSKLLAEDLERVRAKKRRSRSSQKPRGYFHEIYFSPDDWNSLEELTNELAPFLDLTKRIEGDGPTGSMVIAEFYALKAHLDSRAKELQMGEALLPMITSMQARVDKYLEEAMNCDTTVMASILNPFFRLQIFEQGFGQEHPYTIRARNLFQRTFDKRKKELDSKSSTKEVSVEKTAPAASTSKSNETGVNSVFQLFKSRDPEVQRDEVAAYLKGTHPMASADNARECKAILPWWSVNSNVFPVLASLARDYLSLSTSSAIVERTFSAAADICSSDRVRLVPRTIEYNVGSRLWIRQGVPLAHKYTKVNGVIESFGGRNGIGKGK